MDNREIFLTALNLGQPDRVPYFDFFNNESIINAAIVLFGNDIPVLKSNDTAVGLTDIDESYKYLDLQFEVIRKLDIDAPICLFPGKKRK